LRADARRESDGANGAGEQRAEGRKNELHRLFFTCR
jgi:hypothetical protein